MNMSLPLLNAFALSLNVIVTGENASLSALTSLLGSITLSWISGLCKRSIVTQPRVLTYDQAKRGEFVLEDIHGKQLGIIYKKASSKDAMTNEDYFKLNFVMQQKAPV